MRCRYCSTRCRELVRPSFIACCISGIVASTTLNGLSFCVAGVLGVQAAAAARKRTPANFFMAVMIPTIRLKPDASLSKSKHLGVFHDQPSSRVLRHVGELRLVVDDEEIAERAMNQVEADVGGELFEVVAIL